VEVVGVRSVVVRTKNHSEALAGAAVDDAQELAFGVAAVSPATQHRNTATVGKHEC